MKTLFTYFSLILLMGVALPVLAADSPQEVCKSAADLAEEGDVEGALEEARWCVTLLEQQQQDQVGQHFVDEVMGYQGAKLEKQNAMGFTVISRRYQKGSNRVNVSLNAGNSGAAQGVFSALANIGLQAGGGEKVRIQRRTGNVMTENGRTTININLKSGGMLVFESEQLDSDALVEFAKAFPVSEVDDARS